MNDNNLNEENNLLPSPEDNSLPDPNESTSDEDGFEGSPSYQKPEPEYNPPQYPINKPDTSTPAQPQAPTQNNYRPVQGNPPQMPRATYNPYVANTSANPNGTNPVPNSNYYQYPYNRPFGQNIPPAQPQPPQSNGGKNLAIILVAICAVIAVVCIGIGIAGYGNASETAQETTATTGSSQNSTEPTTNLNPETTVNDSMNVSTTAPSAEVPNSVYVAQKVRPSVVGVMTYYDGELTGEGSGVLMSEKNGWTYIITCAHVINEEDVEYRILFLDGTTLEAELVAYDDRTDIGVVRVNKTGLPLAEFGDSSSLQVGEPIYAIGNPGGSEYFGSITDGIVASIDRSVASTYTMTCIQHNAAINPGNSGGALVNASGQVVGINSAKIASMEFEGMGFAVPTSIAGPVVDALINYGYVPNRPKLGIEYAPVSSYQLYSIIVSVKGLPQGSLVIASIADDSSLVGTDAQVGDLIIGVNGKDMTDTSVLLDLIETGAVGDSLTLNLARIDNRTYKVTTFDVVITLVEDKGQN